MNRLAAKAESEEALRNRLFEEHLSLVPRIALHLMLRLPSPNLLDDLIQTGLMGLLEASRSFQLTNNASFKTYASIRIRGSMLDELRRQAWAPRSVFKESRKVAEAIHTVENRTGRAATDREIAEALGETLETYFNLLQGIAGSQLLSVDEELMANSPDESGTPLDALQDKQFQHRLAATIAELPERERLVLALYYDEEMNFKEIGLILEVTESRICQLHSQAISRLKARMKDWIA